MLPELYDEQVEIPEQVPDVVSARRLMIAIRQLAKEIEQTKQTKAAVVASYDAKVDALEERKAKAEGYLRDYLINANGGEKLALPDVGTAYLAKSKPKIEITDMELVKSRWGDAEMYTKRVFDPTKFKQDALRHMQETGEIPEGCQYIGETQDLRIREA